MNTYRSGLAAFAITAALTSAPALAAPTVLFAGQTATFVFNAAALMPYAAVQLVTGFDEMDALAQGGTVTVTGAPTAPGGSVAGCVNGNHFAISCPAFIQGQFFTFPDFLDGDFTISFTNNGTGAAKFSVDPWAKVFKNVNDTFFTRLDPIGAGTVPEPSVLALVAVALAGAGLSRRKA